MKLNKNIFLIDIEMISTHVDASLRDKYTDGEFILVKEYVKFIRMKKIKKINEKNN